MEVCLERTRPRRRDARDLSPAEGEFVKASETENPDLFWGLRGGGGNFGIVTEFEFCLNPVGPTVLAGPIFWPIEEAPNVLRFYREWIKEAPDELMTIVTNRKAARARLWRGLLSQPTSCRHTPIMTTGSLPFIVRLGPGGVQELKLVG